MREGKQKENENLAMIAEAEKIRDVKKAQYEAEISQQQANTRMTGPLAEAQAKQKVVEQEVLVEKIRTQKQTEVAEAEALRKEKELIATVVKPADAKRQATILEAEASQQQTILAAEGHKQAAIATAEADKARREMEGAGEAAATRARGEGEAAAIRAKGDAEASAVRAKLLAEAEGLRAKLVAEAEGVEKKAVAFAHLDQAGKTMLVLERLPEIIREFSAVMGAIAAPMGNIDKVVMIDGGNGGSGGNSTSMSRYAATVPGVLFDLLQKADALGIDLSGMLQKAGIQVADEPKAPAPEPAAPAESK
jgi:flotillin